MIGSISIPKKIHLSPLFTVLFETMLIFGAIMIPLSLNITHKSPPFSIKNNSVSGMSIFNTILQNRGYQTKRLLLSLKILAKITDPSVLVIAGGSKVYSAAELLLIQQYVAKGGLLLLLAGGDTAELVGNSLGIYFGFPILETVNYYKAPDIILAKSPVSNNHTLCFVHPVKINIIPISNVSKEIGVLATNSTAFVDENGDGKWSIKYEHLGAQKLISIIKYGKGTVIAISTPSFLSNDLYLHGFNNIDLILYYLELFFSSKSATIIFDESHKRWPVFTTDGIINEMYGTVVRLSNSVIFLSLTIIALLILYYFLPRYREIMFPKEDFRQVLRKRIWSRERELYDTFGVAVKPTVEEKVLTNLYFLYETEGDLFLNLILKEKLSNIPIGKMSESEQKFFWDVLGRQLDHDTFMILFKKLEKIERRRVLK